MQRLVLEHNRILLEQVMDLTGDVIEDRSASHPADPYVLTLASQLERGGVPVTVVMTTRLIDWPTKSQWQRPAAISGFTRWAQRLPGD